MVNTSKMGDLDINLITLYARTPALYDKRNPLYRDKVYAERAWGDIAEKLGYKGTSCQHMMNRLVKHDIILWYYSGNTEGSNAATEKSLQSWETETWVDEIRYLSEP